MLLLGNRPRGDASVSGARVVNSGQAEEEATRQGVCAARAESSRPSADRRRQQTRPISIQRVSVGDVQCPESRTLVTVSVTVALILRVIMK